MLKSFYKTLDEIPEGDRQHYKKIGDRYVLELDGEHPVQEQNTTLAREKKDEVKVANTRAATAEAEVTRLKAEAERNPTLPSGHVPVPADEAKLLDAVKELGDGADTKAKVESVKTKLTEHTNLAMENATLKKTQVLQDIAADEKLRFKFLRDRDVADGGLQYEKRDVTVDGKTQQVWHVKRDNKWVTVASQMADGAPWADYKPLLVESANGGGGGTRVPGQTADDKSAGAGNIYDQIRKDAAEKQKSQQIVAIPLEKRLHMS